MYGTVAGATIGALGSLAGGALAGKSSRDAANNARVDNLLYYQQNRRDAQNALQIRKADALKAGIHPLYALGMTPPSISPPQSVGQTTGQMGEGVARASDHIANAIQSVQSDQQNRLTEAQIQKLNADKLNALSEMGHNQAVTDTLRKQTGARKPVTGDLSFGAKKNVKFDKNWSNAEDVEKRYGDIGSALYGVIPAVADMFESRSAPVKNSSMKDMQYKNNKNTNYNRSGWWK